MAPRLWLLPSVRNSESCAPGDVPTTADRSSATVAASAKEGESGGAGCEAKGGMVGGRGGTVGGTGGSTGGGGEGAPRGGAGADGGRDGRLIDPLPECVPPCPPLTTKLDPRTRKKRSA